MLHILVIVARSNLLYLAIMHDFMLLSRTVSRRVVGLVFALTLAIAAQSCQNAPNPSNNTDATISSQISSSGVIVFRDRDGGFFGILNDTGSIQYVPVNLPASFRKDGLHVRFHATPRGPENAAHGWGTPVDVASVELLK